MNIAFLKLKINKVDAVVAILTNNSTKKITKPYKVSGGIFCYCHVTEEGWDRRGGKGEGGCGEISLSSSFVRISFPCPWVDAVSFLILI